MSRKLFLFGKYSLALLPPKKWLTELGIQPGDTVQLELDSKKGRIVIRVGQDGQTFAPKPVAKTVKKTTKKADDGWQPVPQL